MKHTFLLRRDDGSVEKIVIGDGQIIELQAAENLTILNEHGHPAEADLIRDDVDLKVILNDGDGSFYIKDFFAQDPQVEPVTISLAMESYSLMNGSLTNFDSWGDFTLLRLSGVDYREYIEGKGLHTLMNFSDVEYKEDPLAVDPADFIEEETGTSENRETSTSDFFDFARNQTPNAKDDENDVAEDTRTIATGNVLENDSDADGDRLVVTSFTTESRFGSSLSIDSDGEYEYVLNNSNPAIQSLAVGEQLVDTFTYNVSDGRGGTAKATLVIRITGTNDAPEVDDATGSIYEDADPLSGALPQPTDVDTSDIVTFEPVTGASGTYGTFTIGQSGNYTYQLNNSLNTIQALAVGDTVNDTITYRVSDGNGGYDTGILTVVINGTNDAPVAANEANEISEDDAPIFGNMPDVFDIDAGDSHLFAPQTTAGEYGTFSIAPDGSYSYTLNNGASNVQQLSVRDTVTETFTVTVRDEAGATDEATVTIVVRGTNDPITVGNETDSVVEDGDPATGVLPVPEDIDQGDSYSFDPRENAAGEYGSFTIDSSGNYTYQLNHSLEAVQALSAGDTLTDKITYTVRDGNGSSDQGELTITITGTNDDPVVGDQSDTIAEDDISVSAILPAPTDIDANDTVAFVSQSGTIGSYGTFDIGTDGSYTYTLDNTKEAVQQLAVGQTLTDTVTYTVDDGNGGTDTGILTIVISGTNDNPEVADHETGAREDGEPINGNLPTPTDIDTGDVLTFTGKTTSGEYGEFVIDPAGQYTYTINNSLASVQQLAVGQTVTDTVTYTVSDNNGGSTTGTLTVVITGQNDAPVVGDQTDSIYEDDDPVSGALPTPTDIDNGDTVTFEPIENASGKYGTFQINQEGQYTYQLDSSAPVIQQLAVGDVLFDTIEYTVTDGNGETDTGTLTITIQGRNDGPAVENVTASIAEDQTPVSGTLPEPTDIDNGDTISFTPIENAGTEFGTISIDSAGNYIYSLNSTPAEIQQLAVGETLTDTVSYTVTDSQGATATATLDITITGTNDKPSVGDQSDQIEEDSEPIHGSLPAPQDIDNGAAHQFDALTDVAGEYGTFTVNPDGTYTYVLNNSSAEIQALAKGANLTDTISYTVRDEHGSVDTGVLTITILGKNDAPNASPAASSINEDAEPVSGTLPTPADVDNGDTHSFIELSTAGNFGTFQIDSEGNYTYQLNNSLQSVQQLAVGDTVTDSIQYTVTDSEGATSTSSLTITIHGQNDAPEAGDWQASTFEDSPPISGSLPEATDIDNGDTVSFQPQEGFAGEYGTFQITADGNYTYNLNNSLNAVQSLAVGQSITDSITYTVIDQHGATNTGVLQVLIEGRNDAPEASATENEIFEDSTPITGSLPAATDIDSTDTHSYKPATISGEYGTLQISADGQYTYTLNNSLPAVQQMAPGDTVTENFEYTLFDNNGASDTAALTIVVKGTNDNPQVADSVDSIFEDDPPISGDLNTPTDIDNSDTVTFVPLNTTGTYGTISIDANGAYQYQLNNQLASVQSLAEGATAVESVIFQVRDSYGATTDATLHITITGRNDAPEAADADGVIYEDDPPLQGNLPVPTEIDNGDVVTFASQSNVAGRYGTFTINADGSYEYNLDSSPLFIQQMDANSEPLTDSISYQIDDGNGGTDTATLTITIRGKNDAPDTDPDSGETVESFGLFVTLLNNDSDIENHSLSITDLGGKPASVGTPVALSSGALATLRPDGTVFYDPNGAFNYLNSGESTEDVFTYTVSDGNGGTTVENVTITINGEESETPPVAWLSQSDKFLEMTVDPVTESVTYTQIADHVRNVNSTAYNDSDGLLYAVDTNENLISVNPNTGEISVLADLSALGNSTYRGDIDPATNTYYLVFGSTMYAVDLSDPAYPATNLGKYSGGADFAFDPVTGLIWSATPNNVHTFDPATGDRTTVGDGTGLPSGTYGGMYADDQGNLVAVNNNGGLYSIDKETGVGTFIANSPKSGSNDAASPHYGSLVTSIPYLYLDSDGSSGVPDNGFYTDYLEGGPAISIADSDINIFDFDTTQYTGATITLNNPSVGDSLNVGTLPAGITASTSIGAGGKIIVTLSGTGIDTAWESAIRAITFSNSQSPPETSPRLIETVIHDSDGNASLTSRTTILITPTTPPVVVDLDGDGAEFDSVENGISYDVDNDGQKELTAWANEDDGILVYDGNDNDQVDDNSEFAFAQYVEGAETDLEGLAHFDSDGDQQLDADDDSFDKFKVWRDENGNGAVDGNEMQTLEELGIESISLVRSDDGYLTADGDVYVHGESLVTYEDGSTGIASDASFALEEFVERDEDLTIVVNEDGEEVDLNETPDDPVEAIVEAKETENEVTEAPDPSSQPTPEDDAAAAAANAPVV